ncbi:lysophospholipid acyltransferase family protein [Cognatishimia sp. F0-27]|uniref:lysophospholipid acyltransferase family protein n=1 Tax=Cognatishimia sp. F0-27 TaxID=2816855 RepID=UPI001D0C7326|nr:lysophospholipid acyltransferase family protein [Cognatishimia sp. F0-27]MCC1491115.1 lysophospholipid acyltransferase family protein [Cognatishimia sp. F0-27]
MVESSYTIPAAKREPTKADVPYDKRKISYATTFTNPWKATVIRTMEWMTGKIWLLRVVRKFERMGPAEGQKFWSQALGVMGIRLTTPQEQIARIPAKGPVIIVANHPHGLVDGMVLAELIGRVREDYKILTRSLLTGVSEIEEFMIPVPFPHEDDAREQSLEMRARAMRHLKDNGVIVLFPSGVVSASETWWGPAIEKPWNPFTAKMIQRSGATVVPIYFPGQNSRLYQIANQISATLRQGLLIHEVVHAFHKPQKPVVGEPITPDEVKAFDGGQREFVTWLREKCLNLKER